MTAVSGEIMKGARQRKLVSRRDAENAEKKKEIKPSVSPCLRVSASPRVVEIKREKGAGQRKSQKLTVDLGGCIYLTAR